MKTQSSLALFDFDGTISRKDSMLDFIRFAVGHCRYYSGLIKQSPMLLSYLLKRTPNSKAKQLFMAHYLSQLTVQEFDKLAEDYACKKLPYIIRPSALERIHWHQQQQHRIVIVSAAIEDWLKPWAQQVGVELIASKLDKNNSHLTGCLNGHNCHGAEKVHRLKNYLKLDDYTYIYAYGDSSGDNDMLALADEAHYKPFR